MDINTGFQHLSGLAVADFNGDGKPDFAVTDGLDKRVVVYLNNGNGTFSSPISTTLQINNTTGNLVAGDFNEDGKQDLIVGTVAGANQDEIFLSGNGDGTFTQQQPLPRSFGMVSAAVADINHDSHLDLIVGGNSTLLYVYLGNGHGAFTSVPLTNGGNDLVLAVTAADFKGHGNIDFVTATYQGQVLRYFPGNGDGTFGTPIAVGPSIPRPESLATADFNGDGKPDLIVGLANAALILFGNGDGTFQSNGPMLAIPAPVAQNLGQSPPLVAVADMNGDGKVDAVTADSFSNSVNVFLNDGTGTFKQTVPNFTASIPAGSGQLMLADFNGDGLPDVIITNYITQNVSIFMSIK